MFGMPSFKTMGFAGVIIAVLAYLFKDNPLIQGLLEMLGFGGKAEGAEQKTGTQAQGGGSNHAQAQPQTEPVKQTAEEVMASWKQGMAESNVPPAVQQVIAAKEPQLIMQLKAAKTPEEMANIQMAAYAEATKPAWDSLVNDAKKEVGKIMDDTIREVAQSSLPAKEKQEALTNLKKEKELRVKGIEAELKNIPIEQRVQIALAPEAKDKILGNITTSLKGYTEEVEKNVSQISRQNNGWAWGSSILGWGSLALAVGGIAAAPFTGGLSLGLTVAACGTGMAAGACKVVNNYDKNGSNFDFGLGIAEIGLNALPMGGLAAKSLGLFAKSAGATATASGSLLEKAAAYVPGLSKATLAEGQAITAVENSTASLTKILGKGTLFSPTDMNKAMEVMKAITSGEATVQAVAKTGNTASQVILKNSAGIIKIYEGDLAKLVGQALTEHKFYDPILGKSANAWRAISELGYTTADDTVKSLVPSSTPEVLPSNSALKTTLAP